MTEDFSSILHTKLHRPSLSRDLILRPRLLDQLNEGLDRHITLVCAPAGFGKTMLVSSWIETLRSVADPIPVAWLSLEQSDSDVVHFTRYLIAALRTVFKEACLKTAHLLNGLTPPSLPLIITTLSNEIDQLPQRFVLVLEDYHLIRGEVVHDLLNELLQHWPRPLRLVLVSRTNPPLQLPRLRAGGKLVEIRSSDLRFSRAETAAFLDRVLRIQLSQQAIDILSERTEGWIGALRLATLSLGSATNMNDRILKLTDSEEDIASYLADEVLQHQFTVIQSFLLKTSILDRFCTSLCEALIGELDPAWNVQACIDWLISEGLFVISLDDDRYWYRYHHMFLDFLRNRARVELREKQIASLHRKAANWYAWQGMPDEAFHHSLESGDLDLTAQLISDNLRDALNREDRVALERWMRLLPDEYIQQRPELLIIKAWICQFTWQLDAQAKLIRQIEALLNDDRDTPIPATELKLLRAQIAVLKAQSAYFSLQPDLGLACCREALDLLPESWIYVRGLTMLYLSLFMQLRGESRAAERLLLDQFEALTDKTNVYALRVLVSLCFVYLNDADYDQVYRTARAGLSLTEASGLGIMQGWAHFFMGYILYQWNDLEAAEQHFEYLANNIFAIQVLSAREGISGLALIHGIKGDFKAAGQFLDHLSQIDFERMGAEADRTRSLRTRLKLMDGDLEAAERWADTFTAPPTHQLDNWLETPHLTQARILLARNQPGDADKALRVLDALAAIAEETHNTRSMIEIQALRALALEAQGKATAALDALERALDLARPGGLIRVFVDLGPPMRKLLTELALTAGPDSSVWKIIGAFPESEPVLETGGSLYHSLGYPSSGKANPMVESLTTREREILIYMREPVSLKEIADRLSLRYTTLKRHTANIYGKLGVNSRWEAVAIASELGLLMSN